ncbi:hypothetical protein Hanom_Chr09g00871841 [Helianthus anomalus]
MCDFHCCYLPFSVYYSNTTILVNILLTTHLYPQQERTLSQLPSINKLLFLQFYLIHLYNNYYYI